MPYTYDQNDTFSLIPDGEYEAQIERIEKRETASGKRKLSVQFRIRSDVDQQCKNRVVFEDIWAEKDNPDFYNRKRLNKLIGTQKIEDGHVFGDIDDVIGFLTGAYLIISVGKEFDDYTGEDRQRVRFYKPSKNGAKEIGAKPEPADANDAEDDLPF